MSAPILKRGDLIHLAMPSTGSVERDKELFDQITSYYAIGGITTLSCTHAGSEVKIVSVIRNE